MPINSLKAQRDRIVQSTNTGQARPMIVRDAPKRVDVVVKKKDPAMIGAKANPLARRKYGTPAPIQRDSTALPS
jgi:hypothetical protein